MVGKPRPDMLARCNADVTNIGGYIVGGYGTTLDSEASPFVSSAICRQTDKRLLDDGFAAFPSGHSSFNSAGMVYLALWLCARWNIAIPLLDSSQRSNSIQARYAKAAPPLWQVAVALVPIFVALFVCSSRYADFHHAGIDIFAGAVIGTVFGWASFRLYHLPIRRSKTSPAWGPRTAQHAFTAHLDEYGNAGDEEQGRQSLGTELDYLTAKPPPRVDTSGSQRPILQGSPDQIRRG